MPILYHVTIKPAQKENRYRITWHNVDNDARTAFDRNAEITLEESQRLWQRRRFQLSIGEKLFRFLDGDDGCFQQALNRASHLNETLQVHLDTCTQTDDWPFELLAHKNIFLLPRQLHLVRGLTNDRERDEIIPGNRPLRLLFMACSAVNTESELNFEKEEEAIFHITEQLAIDMDVEDSGTLSGLGKQLKQKRYDVVHLSGRANIDESGYPYFVMEDEIGNEHRISPDELWKKALIKNPPHLLFLSGGRTGEAADTHDTSTKSVIGTKESFARFLIETGQVPAVLGWGGPVNDKQSTLATGIIYRDLSRGKSILDAARRARFELIKNFKTVDEPAWPLLRLFSGDSTMNALVKKEQLRRPQPRRLKHNYLKNSRVRVLIEGFVGRRRQLQQCLRVLQPGSPKTGVVLLGTGGLGKSCLAGKICERFRDHTLIIVHGKLNAITLKRALKDAFIFTQDHKSLEILAQQTEMTDKLKYFCSTHFKEKKHLLLLDDFEQNLHDADKGRPGPVIPEAANILNTLISFLPTRGQMTQLIITCRYPFFLDEENGGVLEERLEKVWLTGFHESEQRKKLQELDHILNYKNPTYTRRLLAAGCGNPRLMEWMNTLVGRMATAEIPLLLEAVKGKKEDFIRVHVLRELLQKGGETFTRFLRWLSIFRRSVPGEAVVMVVEKAGLNGWQELLRTGMHLSLIEYDQVNRSYLVTPLLREELLKNANELKTYHKAALVFYRKICGGENEGDPILTEEWVYHALGSGEENEAADQGGRLVNIFRENLAFEESLRVGNWVFAEKKFEYSTSDDAFLLNEFATTLYDIGDYQTAITYYEKALAIDRKLHGEMHPDVAARLLNIGTVWETLAVPKNAVEYYDQALSIDRMLYGEMHSNIAEDLNSLGSAWNDLGDHNKAIEYCKQALAINRAVHGEEHQNVAEDLNNIGDSLMSLGKYREAVQYYEKALSINMSVYGEEHPNTARDLNRLGRVRSQLGEHRKAIDYWKLALSIDETVYETAHPNIAEDLNNLGVGFELMGEYRTALFYYEKAMNIFKELHGEKHPNVASALHNLGTVWDHLGKHGKAIDYFKQALTMTKTLYGERHPNAAIVLNMLGASYDNVGKHREAIEYFQEALSIIREVYGDGHPEVAVSLNNLGLAWYTLGKSKQAIENFEGALVIDRAVYGNKHSNVAIELANLGLAWDALGDHGKAVDYYRQALSINRAEFGEGHPRQVLNLYNIGNASASLGYYRQAIDYYRQALEIAQKSYTDGHYITAHIFKNLGTVHFNIKQMEPAKEYFEQAYRIFNKFFGPEHPKTKAAKEWLAMLPA